MLKKKILYAILIITLIVLLLIGLAIINPSIKGKSILPTSTVYAATLEKINTNMDTLMAEIEKEMTDNPELAMMGSPITIIEESQAYQKIIELGLNGVKPLYDKLYNSQDSGLYEYILALAIEDITKEEFIYNKDYGWKNSLEFRMAYETKVNNVQTNVEKIINDENLSDEDKLSKFKEQGIFAVSFLINEYNNNESKVAKAIIKEAIQDISNDYNIDNNNNNNNILLMNAKETDDFIIENKDLFDSLVDLNGKAYE